MNKNLPEHVLLLLDSQVTALRICSLWVHDTELAREDVLALSV